MKRLPVSHWSYGRILAGDKTATRRVIRHQPPLRRGARPFPVHELASYAPHQAGDVVALTTKHLRHKATGAAWDRATRLLRDGDGIISEHAYVGQHSPDWNSNPAFLMPVWAAVDCVRIDAVYSENLWDIDESEIVAEGIARLDPAPFTRFRKLWDSLNPKAPRRWEDNPAVYAYLFTLLPRAAAAEIIAREAAA